MNPMMLFFRNLLFLSLTTCLLHCQHPLQPQQTEVMQPSLAEDRLQSVVFPHPDTGYVVGGQRFDHSLLMRTTDGGESWEKQFPDEGFEWILFDVDFLNSREGIATGLGGFLLRTNTAGRRWLIALSPILLPIHAVSVVHDSLQVAVGGIGYDEGIILRSTNMGRSWNLVDSLEVELRDVCFPSETIGYACGYGAIYQSTDGGLTWGLTSANGEFFTSLSFPTPEIGYAVGRTGSILKTEDAGQNWTRLRNGNNPFLPRHFYNQVQFLDPETGYVVGDNGMILKTINGGETWQRFEREPQVDWYRLHLFEEGAGLLMGSAGTMIRFRE